MWGRAWAVNTSREASLHEVRCSQPPKRRKPSRKSVRSAVLDRGCVRDRGWTWESSAKSDEQACRGESGGKTPWAGAMAWEGGRRDSSQLVTWVQSPGLAKPSWKTLPGQVGPLLSALAPEPLLVAGAMLGAGDISEPDRQTPALGGLVFQREETEERIIGCVGCLRVSPVGEKMDQKGAGVLRGAGGLRP